ncbi:MAG: hypothetical protein ACRDPQ_17715 [Nocardioidaceae bacterium]
MTPKALLRRAVEADDWCNGMTVLRHGSPPESCELACWMALRSWVALFVGVRRSTFDVVSRK